MRLSPAQRRTLVEVIVDKLPEADASLELENMLSLSEIPDKPRIRRRSDPFSFTLSIVQHCEAYGVSEQVNALEALLDAVITTLGGWTDIESDRLAQLIAPEAARAQPLPASESHDVFLCHNHKDKPQVRELARRLGERGLRPWLDERSLLAGAAFASDVDRAITTASAALVCAGRHGVGRWQELEIRALLRHSVERGLVLIPTILADHVGRPAWLGFLDDLHQVDFRGSEPDPLEQLVAGIARTLER